MDEISFRASEKLENLQVCPEIFPPIKQSESNILCVLLRFN